MGEASSPCAPARLKLTNTWRSARISSVSSLDFVTIATVNWEAADFREASEGPGSDEGVVAGTAARAVFGPETTGKGIGSETRAGPDDCLRVFPGDLREAGSAWDASFEDKSSTGMGTAVEGNSDGGFGSAKTAAGGGGTRRTLRA